jgi:hypothetical protein
LFFPCFLSFFTAFHDVHVERVGQVHGIIYVVDAAAQDRFEESKEALISTLESEGITGKPVLVFANKQDLDGAASAPDLTKVLGLLDRKDLSHRVAPCIAKPAEGQPVDKRIGESLNWLLNAIDKDYAKLHDRVVTEKAERDRKEKERREAQRKRAEESKAQRLREQAEAERLQKEQENGGGAHARSEQAKPATEQAWASDDKAASVRAPADVDSSTTRDGVVEMTPVRKTASLEITETPGKDEAPDGPPRPNRLPALEVDESMAGSSSPGGKSMAKPKLGSLKPMPPPVNTLYPETAAAGTAGLPVVTLPNAMPSPGTR